MTKFLKYDALCGRCAHHRVTHETEQEGDAVGRCWNGLMTTWDKQGKQIEDRSHMCDCSAYQAEGETYVLLLCQLCGEELWGGEKLCSECGDLFCLRIDEDGDVIWNCYGEHQKECPVIVARDNAKLEAWTKAATR